MQGVKSIKMYKKYSLFSKISQGGEKPEPDIKNMTVEWKFKRYPAT